MKHPTLTSLLVLALASAPSCIAVASRGKPVADTTTVHEVLHLQYAAADDLVPILRGVIPDTKARILSDTRTNSLVVKSDKATMAEIQELVAQLDIETKRQ